MTIKRILIFTPILLMGFLVQSYFWVPTYEEQTRGNPGRLKDYITASIGDASLLNPILLSDTASGEIEGLVFDRLVDFDETLRFRGRLATSWELYEEAYFYVNHSMPIPALGKIDAKRVGEFIKNAQKRSDILDSGLKASLNNISAVSLVQPAEFFVTRQEKDAQIKLHIKAPARIKLTMTTISFTHQKVRYPCFTATRLPSSTVPLTQPSTIPSLSKITS